MSQKRHMSAKPSTDQQGVATRRLALEVLARVEDEGAYSNLALSHALSESSMDAQDRGFVTDLVYGSLRRRRSCDHLVDRFLSSDPPPAARRVLRLGAYQLAYRPDVPTYAAVSATVDAAPKRFRGLTNAVLRNVSSSAVEFPDEGTRLSYPDWIMELLVRDLGREDAIAALEQMNESAAQSVRSDGYTQDLASQKVVELVDARSGELVLDLCAAPGGKATGIAASGAQVVAADLQPHRVGLIAANAQKFGLGRTFPMVADALQPPFRAGVADRVLLDAPCSGLGVLRRRPDARWRLEEDAPERLADLQKRMVTAALATLKPGGTLVYSVCTLTAVETLGVDDYIAAKHPELEPLEIPSEPWRRWGRGAMLLPQEEGTDGMCLFRYRYSR
ncbi:MAG: transcription antitermination factor NusB [Microthrixaceae bacterium]